MESVTFLSTKTRSQKLEVIGGFYSREDMKTVLGYKEPRGQQAIYRVCTETHHLESYFA